MGYNINLIDAENPRNSDCRIFINRSFYSFLVSYESYGDSSVVIQSGKYFNLDLYPLTKIAYLEDLTIEELKEIDEKKISLESLKTLVEKFKDKINQDLKFIQNVEFQYEDYYARYSEIELKRMKADGLQIDPDWNEKVEMHKYFIDGQINKDLDVFCEILYCLQSKNVKEVVITAG